MFARTLKHTQGARSSRAVVNGSALMAGQSRSLHMELSEDQRALQGLARQFARNEVLPAAPELDRQGEYPHALFEKAHKLGLCNAHIPEEHGGLGLSCADGTLVVEEIAYACAGVSAVLNINTVAQLPLILAGNTEQKRKYLEPMVAEPKHAAYCVTEPGAGSDVQGIRTQAKRTAGGYVLNGQKMWITNGGVADWYFVLAKDDAGGFQGLIVDRDSDGVSVGAKEDMLGQRASDTRAVFFEDVFVPESNRIGADGQGFKIAMAAFDYSRPTVAITGVALAQRCLDEAAAYAKERKSFGVPIAHHGAVQQMMANMAMRIEATRLLSLKAAWECDVGLPNSLSASAAKALAGELATSAASDCVQIFGGMGYSNQCIASKLYRDAKILALYEGTTQIQHMVVFRNLLARG